MGASLSGPACAHHCRLGTRWHAGYRGPPYRSLALGKASPTIYQAAAIAWLVMSILFSWYAAHFGSYNKTYGSLGAIIGFMTWIWLSSVVVLLGAELDAEMEHQTARDTTTGEVADTVGGASD
jgi:membrane protein